MGGGDKPLTSIAGLTLLDRVVYRFSPQVERLVISANGDPTRYACYGVPVIPDTVPGFAGPLAGILAGMLWARRHMPHARYVASAAADTPFFPVDLVQRLAAAGGHDAIALAASGSGTHPTFGLWPVRLADAAEVFLADGEGKLLAFAERNGSVNVAFEAIRLSDGSVVDPFFNVNTPGDIAAAAGIAHGFT